MMVPATIRDAVEDDYSFIYHSWLKSYRATWDRGANTTRHIDKDVYYYYQKHIIRDLLQESHVMVAVNPDDLDQIYGYCLAQTSERGCGVIHYIFVKQSFRRLGIATLLYAEARRRTHTLGRDPMIATHATGVFHKELGEKYNVIYNPYLLFREDSYDEDERIAARANR